MFFMQIQFLIERVKRLLIHRVFIKVLTTQIEDSEFKTPNNME